MEIVLRAAPEGARSLLPALTRLFALLWPRRIDSSPAIKIDAADERQLRDLGLDPRQIGRSDWTRAPTSWLEPPMT